jgi:hypothetical protein
MINTEEKARNKVFPGAVTCYRQFTFGFAGIANTSTKLTGEASLSMDFRNGSRLPVTKGGPLYRTNACVPAAGNSSLLTQIRVTSCLQYAHKYRPDTSEEQPASVRC